MNRAWTIVFLAIAAWVPFLMVGNAFAIEPLGYQVFCLQHSIECHKQGPSKVSFAEVGDLLQNVNRRVNAAIQPKADANDKWSLSPHSGDCEDYALTKRSLLRQAGVPTNAMRIGIFKLSSGENHAVLIVRTDEGDIVLDNLSRNIKVRDRQMNMI